MPPPATLNPRRIVSVAAWAVVAKNSTRANVKKRRMTKSSGTSTYAARAKKFEVNSRRMPIDDATFKLAMSHFPSGVTVVTTEHDGKPYGLTVSAFASLSLHPPLVLVSIEKNVKSHDAIAAAGKCGVS